VAFGCTISISSLSTCNRLDQCWRDLPLDIILYQLEIDLTSGISCRSSLVRLLNEPCRFEIVDIVVGSPLWNLKGADDIVNRCVRIMTNVGIDPRFPGVPGEFKRLSSGIERRIPICSFVDILIANCTQIAISLFRKY